MNWIWIAIRVTGLTAYLLLTLSLIAGILRHLPKRRGYFIAFHRAVGQLALLFIAVHAYLLLFDSYEPFTMLQVFVPFMAAYHPMLTGIGTLSAYMLLIVIITSDYMNSLGYKLWKKTHLLVFPLWVLAFLHSFFIGTDSSAEWAKGMYAITGMLVTAAVCYLIYQVTGKKNRSKRKSASAQEAGA